MAYRILSIWGLLVKIFLEGLAGLAGFALLVSLADLLH